MKAKFFMAAAIALALVSCKNAEETRHNTIIDDYLYGVEYDDYNFEEAHKIFDKKMSGEAPACTEVRKGNFVGRNLDWYINCDASAIIKINKSEKRFASIGMCGCNPLFNDSIAKSGEFNPIYNILPLATCDGINENGVYIGVNVMPTGETSFDKAKWQTGKWGLGAAYTNPDAKETYCVSYLVRFVLDNAKSVAHAKELINAINWFEPKGFPHPGQSQAFHWLISDATTSAVLEFIDNKPCYTETTEITEPSYATIMTNFTNKLMNDAQLIQDSGCGYERWDLVKECYPDVTESFEDFEGLMKKVWYTNSYTKDVDDPNFFATEFYSPEVKSQTVYKNPDLKNYKAYMELVNDSKAQFADKNNWHKADTPLWYTTHTSIYDLQKRELRVLVHEGMDGQKTFFKADLNSTFTKPLQ